MKVRGVKTVLRTARWLRSRCIPRGLILLYHRIAEAPLDPYCLCVSPKYFAEHLAVLRDSATPLSCADLIEAARAEHLPRRPVAVTFDDGYADNLHEAKPLLLRYEIPATVFVATGYLGATFWWDDLARLLLLPDRLPPRLSLTADGHTRSWTLNNNSAQTRRHLLRSLHGWLRTTPPGPKLQAVNELRRWAGGETGPDPLAHGLKPPEIVSLAEDGLIEVGAHSVTHRPLARLLVAEQRSEVQDSKHDLETLLHRPVTAFSYPYGLARDFTAETVSLLRDCGFAYACTNVVDVAWRKSDPLRLPRLWVGNWSGEEFRHRLRWWLGG